MSTRSPTDTLHCKTCHRPLATLSPTTGAMQPLPCTTDPPTTCTACPSFAPLFTAYEAAKQGFAALQHRRDDFGPRVAARDAVHGAQLALGNFVVEVGRWGGEEEGEEEEEEGEGKEGKDKHDAHVLDTHLKPKRPLSLSPSLSPPSAPGLQPGKRQRQRPRGHKRRISFDPSALDDAAAAAAAPRRTDAAFSRTSAGYAPGRWAAPPGSTWLDTSGSGTTVVKFTGVAKRGARWVATREGVRLDEEWELGRGEEGGEEGGEGEGEGEGVKEYVTRDVT